MDIAQSLKVALSSLMANKLRSALTMLGMVIGVGAVITLMSIGQGAQKAVQDQFNSLGTNLIFVEPGTTNSGGVRQQAGSVQTLTYPDAKALNDQQALPHVTTVSPQALSFAQVVYQNQNTVARVKGITSEYPDLVNYHTTLGSDFSDDQVTGNAQVAILGATLAKSLFGDQSPIGRDIRLNTGGPGGFRSATFNVIGVGPFKGGSGQDNSDTRVYVPLTTMFRKLSHQRTGAGIDVVSNITVQASDAASIPQAEQEMTDLLMQRHHITDPTQIDFSITSQQDQLQTRQQVTGVLTIFLGAVAGISLVVGGIGIMNIMIVSVTERTREIGIRKAVGARRQDILLQFLVESLLVSVLGGAGGILAGVGIAQIVNGQQLNGQALQTLITAQSVVLAAGVSAAIGLFFGIYPASRAAKMNPIEALRYE
jgi:putative ABC transport system permease protein